MIPQPDVEIAPGKEGGGGEMPVPFIKQVWGKENGKGGQLAVRRLIKYPFWKRE